MTTLGELISETRTHRFVGRTKELALFAQFVASGPDQPATLLNFWGQAGMGKSSLLAKIESFADSDNFVAVGVDFRRQATPILFLRSLHEQLPYSDASDAADTRFRADLQALDQINARLIHALSRMDEPDDSSDLSATLGEAAGRTVGEWVSQETGLPMLAFLGAAGGSALGVQFTRWHLRRLASAANVSADELALITNSASRLTTAVLESLVLRVGAGDKYVLLLDHHEYVTPFVDDWLREEFLSGLPTAAKPVAFRRRPLTDLRHWEDFNLTIIDHELKPFDDDEAVEFWRTRGVDDPVKGLALHEAVQGHPYKGDILGALVRRRGVESLDIEEIRELGSHPDMEERLMARYLDEVGAPEEQQLLHICAVPRWFDRDLLTAIAPETVPLYERLRDVSFVEAHIDGGLALHSLARDSILKREKAANPLIVGDLHQKIADHLALRRQGAGRFGLEYLGDEVYHRLAHSEPDGLDFALAVVRDARLAGLHAIEDNVYAEIAHFAFVSARGTSWQEFAAAHGAMRRGDWNETSDRVERLSAASWPDEELVLRLTELRLELLTGRGSYEDAYRLESDALQHVRSDGDRPALALAYDIFDLQARHIETCAILSRFDEAFSALDLALEAADQGTPTAARLLLAGAAACRLRGDVVRGLTLARDAVGVSRAVGDPRALCFALIQQSRIETHDGRWARAETLLDEARELEREAPDQYNRANAILFRANILRKRGMHDEAYAEYEASLTLHFSMRSDREIAPLYGSLGLVYLALGSTAKAKSYLDKSLTMKIRQSYYRGVGITHNYLGLYSLAQSDTRQARVHFSTGENIGAQYELHYLKRWSRLGLTRCSIRAGEALGGTPPSSSRETAPVGFGSDIDDAQSLYDLTRATTYPPDVVESMSVAITRLLQYHPSWAYDIVEQLLDDVKRSPIAATVLPTLITRLNEIAHAPECRACEELSRAREEIPSVQPRLYDRIPSR